MLNPGILYFPPNFDHNNVLFNFLGGAGGSQLHLDILKERPPNLSNCNNANSQLL